MREKSSQLIQFCYTRTVPAAETESIGLPAYAQLSWFLQSHLDSFIVKGQLRSIYRDSSIYQDSSIWTTLHGHRNFQPSTGILHLDQKDHVHLPGLCKNSCQPDVDGNSIKPPGRQLPNVP
jgi:hypothetical protein